MFTWCRTADALLKMHVALNYLQSFAKFTYIILHKLSSHKEIWRTIKTGFLSHLHNNPHQSFDIRHDRCIRRYHLNLYNAGFRGRDFRGTRPYLIMSEWYKEVRKSVQLGNSILLRYLREMWQHATLNNSWQNTSWDGTNASNFC